MDEGPGPTQRLGGRSPFGGCQIYNRAGPNVYSFNDRATDRGALDFVVLTAEQMIDVRKTMPEDFQKAIFVQVPIGEGIVVVRSFVPDPTWEEATSEFLARIACTKE